MKSSVKGKYSRYIKHENIRAELARRQLTYKEMSEIMGYKSAATFTHFINGICEPGVSKMIAISLILQKPVDYFFNFECEKN